jgi:low affinity Fe/Cu permease
VRVLRRIALAVPKAVGSPQAFLIALLLVTAWLMWGVAAGWGNSWLLWPSAIASVVTFVIAFSLQHTQNRDTRAMQLKLDEIARASGARPEVIKAEAASEEELERVERALADPEADASTILDDTRSLEVARGVVPQERVEDALRLLHLDLLERGASASELGTWLWGMHWFPHLKHHGAILALAESLPAEWRTGTQCDPQILLQFPHTGPEPEITFHVDREPEWAEGRRYLRIVALPLCSWGRDNGGLLVQGADRVEAVEVDPGDAIRMSPELQHSGGINLTGTIRYGVYFRWLADEQVRQDR